MSIEDVKRMRRELPASIPGSPTYFREKLDEVKAACEHFDRLPSFMLTMTANEFNWTETQELSAMVYALTSKPDDNDMKNAFNKAPNEVGRLFCVRLNWFIDSLLLKPNAIFGNVEYFVCKIEFQSRGSPHAHLALWMDNPADVERLNSEITASLPDLDDPACNTPY